MLTRLYVDNYRCLVNFEYRPGQVQLLLGASGSGKSSLLEVLALLRELIVNEAAVSDLLPPETLTRWQSSRLQTFEMDVEIDGKPYAYRLVVEHEQHVRYARIKEECVSCAGQTLFSSLFGKARLYHDDFPEGREVILDWTRSGLSLLRQRRETQAALAFRDWVEGIYCLRISPPQMGAAAPNEEAYPQPGFANFASWYRQLIQETPNASFALKQALEEVLPGFDALSLLAKNGDEARVLTAVFRSDAGKPLAYRFDELSDGQRALVALYAIAALLKEKPLLLCVDEPDNFVMLAEILPWLQAIEAQAESRGSQVLLVSHHPELINYFAPRDAVRLVREKGGPARVRPFTVGDAEPLTPAELVARGWDNE
jgi:predicted ATPase